MASDGDGLSRKRTPKRPIAAAQRETTAAISPTITIVSSTIRNVGKNRADTTPLLGY